MHSEESVLLKRIAGKDADAFNLLFNAYSSALYRFAFYLSDNRENAADLYQETWLRIVQKSGSLNEVRNFKAWAFTIMANIYKDELRKKKIRRLFNITAADHDSSKTEYSDLFGNSAKDDTHSIELNIEYSKAVNNLPDRYRSVFVLKVIDGFKHNDISKILRIPVGTVKSHLHFAVKLLQKELKDFKR
jgi:RNA polymerase sigma-70 factor (ECF subfamily)